MKPYLVHKTWVDLDHVVAIDSVPTILLDGYVQFCFRLAGSSERLVVSIGGEKGDLPQCQTIIAAFVTAWKNKDAVMTLPLETRDGLDETIDAWAARPEGVQLPELCTAYPTVSVDVINERLARDLVSGRLVRSPAGTAKFVVYKQRNNPFGSAVPEIPLPPHVPRDTGQPPAPEKTA